MKELQAADKKLQGGPINIEYFTELPSQPMPNEHRNIEIVFLIISAVIPEN
jgi:hypothetical protein